MPNLLRRNHAPITDEAWAEIDARAKEVLTSHLTARRIVDFSGPHGWQFAAVNLGRLSTSDKELPGQVPWGRREVRPLLEIRIPFELDQMELDSISRGSKDADLAPLETAVQSAAFFEESAVYNGLEEADIDGMIAASEHDRVPLSKHTEEIPDAVAHAVREITLAGVEGPFDLVLGKNAWAELMQSGTTGYPPSRIIADLADGRFFMSAAMEGGLVVSSAAGNFELAVGQDFSIGYAAHDRNRVELYLTESFAFRVVEPKSCVRLEPA